MRFRYKEVLLFMYNRDCEKNVCSKPMPAASNSTFFFPLNLVTNWNTIFVIPLTLKGIVTRTVSRTGARARAAPHFIYYFSNGFSTLSKGIKTRSSRGIIDCRDGSKQRFYYTRIGYRFHKTPSKTTGIHDRQQIGTYAKIAAFDLRDNKRWYVFPRATY